MTTGKEGKSEKCDLGLNNLRDTRLILNDLNVIIFFLPPIAAWQWEEDCFTLYKDTLQEKFAVNSQGCDLELSTALQNGGCV